MNSALKSKALYFLAKREHSYQELFNKLKKYTENEDELVELLQELTKNNCLSEERYIKNYLATKSKRYGMQKIKHLLTQKTADKDLVQQILSATEIDEYEVAKQLWQKKFLLPAQDDKELAKQIRFLQSKGFSFAIIKRVLYQTDKEN